MRYLHHRALKIQIVLAIAAISLVLLPSRRIAARLYAGEPTAAAAARGYRFLTEKPYLPADFDQETFDRLWRQWPADLRAEAEVASPEERRAMAFSRYGLTARPVDDGGKPLQYVVSEKGAWSMNCFACHSGKVAGKVIPGLPNSHYALHTLTEDVRTTKLLTGNKLTHMDIGSMAMPLGRTHGTTNAVMFGVALMAYRKPDLSLRTLPRRPKMVHHDMDAPAWWHHQKKKNLYIDGFAPKGHRALMQFMLVKENGPKEFKAWEDEFRDVYAYIESLEAPTYPFKIDHELASRGEKVFNRACADCHGTYGEDETYPERTIDIDDIGTDRVRHDALTADHRQAYLASWFNHLGDKGGNVDSQGYVAPPLDGVWATAPYLHNGSVPTLWHMLHPDERPKIWQRTEDGYDTEKVGLEVTTFERLPKQVDSQRKARFYFDTRRFGKSAVGHTYPDELNAAEKKALLEYLKTL